MARGWSKRDRELVNYHDGKIAYRGAKTLEGRLGNPIPAAKQLDNNHQTKCSICGKSFTPGEPYRKLCDSCYPGTRR